MNLPNRKTIKHLSAGALTYAISLVLLLSLLSSGLIFISYSHKQVASICFKKEHLVFNNLLALQIGAQGNQKVIYHSTGDTSEIAKKKWGVFEAITVKTFSNNLSVEKTVLIGKMYAPPKETLYINDHRQAIYLGGKTQINGDIYIAEKGLESSTILGKPLSTINFHKGKKFLSKNHLPPLNEAYKNVDFLSQIGELVNSTLPQSDSAYSFREPTVLVQETKAIALNKNLSGNIIFVSSDSILVSKESKLENVILISPVVFFEKGFKGSVQVLASERITCEDSVQLSYPSVLILNEKHSAEEFNQNHFIKIGSESKVLGGILLVMQEPNYRAPIKLIVSDGLIYGCVYNEGNTELQGKIFGHLFTNDVFIQNPLFSQSSCFVDALIDSENLPEKNGSVNWLQEREQVQIKILS
jgi:hypothetical protein